MLRSGHLALVAAAACGDELPRGTTNIVRPEVSGPSLRILTYNVNFEQPSSQTVHAVRDLDADLVVLQEVTPYWEGQFRRMLYADYPTMEFRHAAAEGGMAVLSTRPIEEVEILPSPVGKFPALCVRAQSTLGELAVLLVHLHPPVDENGLFTGYFTTGELRLSELIAHMHCFGGKPDIVAGDFNEAEGKATAWLESKGLLDAAARFGQPQRTWAWPTALGELEGRPDHIFTIPELQPVHVDAVELGGSDHRPLVVTLVRGDPG